MHTRRARQFHANQKCIQRVTTIIRTSQPLEDNKYLVIDKFKV